MGSTVRIVIRGAYLAWRGLTLRNELGCVIQITTAQLRMEHCGLDGCTLLLVELISAQNRLIDQELSRCGLVHVHAAPLLVRFFQDYVLSHLAELFDVLVGHVGPCEPVVTFVFLYLVLTELGEVIRILRF